jgi:hypothetical protein
MKKNEKAKNELLTVKPSDSTWPFTESIMFLSA